MQSIISRVSTNNQIFLNPLLIIEIHNTMHDLSNKTYLIDKRELIDSASLKIITITDVTVGATSDLKLFGAVYIKIPSDTKQMCWHQLCRAVPILSLFTVCVSRLSEAKEQDRFKPTDGHIKLIFLEYKYMCIYMRIHAYFIYYKYIVM